LPSFRTAAAMLMLPFVIYGCLLFIPTRINGRIADGSLGYVTGNVRRFDERDQVFSRNRSLPADSDCYRFYYEQHPENKEIDDQRRSEGGILGRQPGLIDKAYPPYVAMMNGGFNIPAALAPAAIPAPVPYRFELDPERASDMAKDFALHLGADLVGICRVNPLWAYSHRGEIFNERCEDWGRELPAPLPYALVIAVEMDHDLVAAAPHLPAVIESSITYAKGAYITTILAGWISNLGFQAAAEHSRHYSLLMTPLAIDAGLGELGRCGYLVADRFGPRVRLFAVTTDMPLAPDEPVDLGVQEFCRRCRKCADACPSRSIPPGPQRESNGIERWKINENSCFSYWAKVGTDCSICMAACPFSRPDTSLHRITRWFLNQSPLARRTFPYLDRFLYGRQWRSKSPPWWIDHQEIKVGGQNTRAS
jgi:reductive dehalogenase